MGSTLVLAGDQSCIDVMSDQYTCQTTCVLNINCASYILFSISQMDKKRGKTVHSRSEEFNI